MRHRVHARKLGRTSAHRLAMYRNLVTSLLEHEKVETTQAKAMEVRRLAERMITLAKRGDLHARRRALRVIRGKDVAAKVFGELAERYENRPGGYTRVLRTRRRVGDAAEMAIVELVEPLVDPAAKRKGAKADKKKATAKKKAPVKKKTVAQKKAAPKKTAATKKKAASQKKAVGGKRTARKKKAAKPSDAG